MIRTIVNFSLSDIAPIKEDIFAAEGMKPGSTPSPRVHALYDEAVGLFYRLARPVAVMAGISSLEFASIYRGDGKNTQEIPLSQIFPQAGALCLLVLTLGQALVQEIERLMMNGDLARGYMLDSTASFCTDQGAKAAERYFLNYLQQEGRAGESTRVLLYSPGYCGWHISGQARLFDYLDPGEIGIKLTDTYLMTPLKSVSGVLVAGHKSIHTFKNTFPICRDCRGQTCRQRIAGL